MSINARTVAATADANVSHPGIVPRAQSMLTTIAAISRNTKTASKGLVLMLATILFATILTAENDNI